MMVISGHTSVRAGGVIAACSCKGIHMVQGVQGSQGGHSCSRWCAAGEWGNGGELGFPAPG